MQAYLRERKAHWNHVYSNSRATPTYYQYSLQTAYKFHIPEDLRVLELGCGNGDLLAAVKPALGVGVDISRVALARGRERHPELHFAEADALTVPFACPFDVIILSDLVNDLWDVQGVFAILSALSHARTRIVINFHSRLWQWPLALAEKLGIKRPTLVQNWFTLDDLSNIATLTNLEHIKHERDVLLPIGIPLVSWIFNNVLVRFWPFWLFAGTNLAVVRTMRPTHKIRNERPSVSLVIPARNEAGNIRNLIEKAPNFSDDDELIFIEGHSRDETYATIEHEIATHPERNAKLLKQNGVGKAAAVWDGFAAASKDILMIWDSDISVAAEDLPRFYDAAISNKGEFINGSRLVYPMENRAMQLANLVGNKSFGMIFTWLLGQPVKDTLCGTKVIWREDFELLRKRWPQTFDPFGDFDLLLGATKLDLKIVDLPIRYRERVYGQTNISRWRHGLMLLRITILATLRLKFRIGGKDAI